MIPFPDIDPVAFYLGPMPIHWYGLAYVVGILLGWGYARKLVSNNRLWLDGKAPMTTLHLDDFVVWMAVGIVLGGRIGYVFVYDLQAVSENPLRAFEIMKGGMSFHGGLIGSTIAMILFARRNGIPMWSLFDVIATVVPIGLFCGRIANFINGELWGRVSMAPWAIVFPTGGPLSRHPSQLYEAGLEGIVLLLVLFVITHWLLTLKRPGLTTGVFVTGYALSRIFVEFFREPDAQIGYLLGTDWLTMGMVLSLPMILLGLWAAIRAVWAVRADAIQRHPV